MLRPQQMWPVLFAFASCTGPADDVSGPQGGKADSPFSVSDLVEGTAPAVGLLKFVNDPSVSMIILEVHIDLPGNASENILEHRDGNGPGSNLFDDVAELDDVPGVGPATLQRILDFAFDNGFIPQGDEELGTYDGVTFSVNEAGAVVELANLSSEAFLDDDLSLDSRAVSAILDARPISSVLELSKLNRVGASALSKMKDAADISPPAGDVELGIISDLDKTIIPPAPSGQEFPDAPYPGMAKLLSALEFGADGTGADDDIHFVTARQPDRVVDVPDWLEDHNIPTGDISTGISGIPFVASGEKVKDITAVFEDRPDEQRFVMFGDSSHADPDAYREIVETFGDKVIVAFIHDVKDIAASKLTGLVLIQNYAEAADRLLDEGLITPAQAEEVMQEVVDAGLITSAEMNDMLN